jgi:hypothetical protein
VRTSGGVCARTLTKTAAQEKRVSRIQALNRGLFSLH